MKTIITIERQPLIIDFDGQQIAVEELSIRLPFGRKPTNINDICGNDESTIYVTESLEMSIEDFDDLANHLYKSRDWLKGKGGYYGEGRLCVEVHAPSRPYLFIDPSGADHARYAAKIG